MERIIQLFAFWALCVSSVNGWTQSEFSTSTFSLALNEQGIVVGLTDIANDLNYAAGEPAYLLRIKVNGETINPDGFHSSKKGFTYTFPGGYEADLKVTNKATHIRIELLALNGPEEVEAILWGPIKTTISGTIGEYVGVVRNGDFAIGIQSLNVKTTGGALENDEGFVPQRGTVAMEQNYGSSLQAFCIDRTRARKINVWNDFGNTQVVPNPAFNLIGSAIALFGIREENALDLIGEIEMEEGLPHILIDGEWVKSSTKAGRPYIISNFGEATIDKMLEFTDKLGFYSLYQSHPFKNWGHFDLLPDLFPNGRQGMIDCVEKARKRNIRIGVHTLTNFITTNDPFVTPVPHPDLAVFAQTVITGDMDILSTEIPIEDPRFYDKKTSLQTVRIGDELIRFAGVSGQAPFRLLDCMRGAFGTQATSHKEGETIARMVDHPYKTFYPNMDLQNVMIDMLVDFFNETGVSHLDFDGHEGAYSTGYGDVSKDYFALRFIEGVDHMVVNGTSQSSHFYWHINTYMNWGEPWYGGMKESHNALRFSNQAIHERNYQPNMLGWFWFQSGTSLEDMEWMLARAAGWNAGYALVVNPSDLDSNPFTAEIIEMILTWEEARNRGIFDKRQKQLLKAGENDFSLTKASDEEFHLQYYRKEGFVHENLVLQPGQPHYSDWEFDNITGKQRLYFRLLAAGEAGSLDQIVLELDGYQKMEIPVSLNAGYSCIYDGSGKLWVYDEKGSLKQKQDIDFGGINIDEGVHSLQVSCSFSIDSDLELKGMVKLKDNVDIIHL